MKLNLNILCAFLFAATFAFGGPTESFEQANSDYTAGRYAEAAARYETLLKQDGPRIGVLRNLGSAYFQMGQNGRAILAFKRALILDPSDPDLIANLKLAQDQAAVYPPTNDSFWRSFLEKRSARWWSFAALVAAIFLPLAALDWTARKGKFGRWIGAFAALDLAFLALAITGLITARNTEPHGIIITESATVRISPFQKANDRGTLAAGREVTLGKENNGYYWITSADGSLAGWIAQAEVAPLIPLRGK